jgi:hypothetical protein
MADVVAIEDWNAATQELARVRAENERLREALGRIVEIAHLGGETLSQIAAIALAMSRHIHSLAVQSP